MSQSQDSLIVRVEQFLQGDEIDLKNPHFNTTQYIAKLLTDVKRRENLHGIYDEFIAKENQCEDLITTVIEQRYTKFSDLLKAPQVYGVFMCITHPKEKYENLNQMARQSRRRIAKSKELLTKKQQNLKQIHMEAVYHKEIVQLMNKVNQSRQSLQMVENQIHNSQHYDACFELRRLRTSLETFDAQRQKTPMIAHLMQSIDSKCVILLDALKDALKVSVYCSQCKKFFYGQTGNLLAIHETTSAGGAGGFQFDRLSSITLSSKNFVLGQQKLTTMRTSKDFQLLLKDCLQIDLRTYEELAEKNALLSVCLQEQSIQVDDDPYQCLESVSHDQLRRYIEFSLHFGDFKQVKELILSKTNKFGDVLVNHQMDNSLLSFFLVMKGSSLIRKTDQILAEHFKEIENDLREYMCVQILFLIKMVLKSNTKKTPETPLTSAHLLKQLHFEQLDLYHIVTEFFKTLICNCVILLRKHLLLISVIDFFEIELDESTNVMSISQLYTLIVEQLHQVFRMFYLPSSQINKKENFDARQELFTFVHQILSKVVPPSCLYMLLQHELIKQTMQHLHQCIGEFMSSQVHHEPFLRATKNFYDEVDANYEVHLGELTQHFKVNCKEFMSRHYRNDKLMIKRNDYRQLSPLANEVHGDWCAYFALHDADANLKAMLKREFDSLDYFSNISYLIPEFLFFIHNLQIISIFNHMVRLPMVHLLNWSINVLMQDTKYKMKSYLRGSCCDAFLHNTDKVTLLKKSHSYLQWKTKFVQSNNLLNDGIPRLQQQQQNKSNYKALMRATYKDYFDGRAHIKQDQIIKSKESLQVFTALHEHLHGLITACTKIFLDGLSAHSEDHLLKELSVNDKSIFGTCVDAVKRKILIIRHFQQQKNIQSYKLPVNQKNLNALEQNFGDDFAGSILRFMTQLDELLELQKQCYFILRFEVHIRALCHLLHDESAQVQESADFSSNNIQNFYFDAYNFCSNLQDNLNKDNVKMIMSEFWTILKLCLKVNFTRTPTTSFKKKKVQLLLKDFSLLQSELKQLDLFAGEDKKINKCFGTLRRYVKLFLIPVLELEKFLKLNPFKYKALEVQEFLRIKIGDVKKEDAQDHQTRMLEVIKKYCL